MSIAVRGMTGLVYDHVGAGGERVPTTLRHRPGMAAFANHILATHGGRNLGIYGNRPIRGGTSKSVHAVSRAFDWGWPDRATAEKVLNGITADDAALARIFGIQACHDYYVTHPQHRDLGRTWGHGRGWHWGHIGSAGGHWIHFELTIPAAEDANLMGRLGTLDSDASPPPTPDSDPDGDDSRRHPHPTLRRGSKSPEVVLLQTILQDWHRARPDLVANPGPADGDFGAMTDRALRGFQGAVLKVPADGEYGPITADALDKLARYLEAAAGR